jgi:hypothetical protein
MVALLKHALTHLEQFPFRLHRILRRRDSWRFLWGEAAKGVGNGLPEVWDGSRGGASARTRLKGPGRKRRSTAGGFRLVSGITVRAEVLPHALFQLLLE